MPEIPFSIDDFVNHVREVLKRIGRCVITVGEGIRDDKGNLLAETGGAFGKDSFGHAQLGGVGECLREVIEKEVGVKCRANKLGTCQRNGMHFASLTDRDEAYLSGATAVQAALEGESYKMITLVRQGTGPDDYKCTTGLADLETVANGEKMVPREYINQAGNHVTAALKDYVIPLMRGQVAIDIGPDGLPLYPRLSKHMLDRRTARSYSTA
jgi:6-phosphofructokinase 1